MIENIPDIECHVGDSPTLAIKITSDGVDYPLTGHTLSWLFSKERASAALLQLDVTSHTDATAGESAVTLTPANLTTIGGAGEYWLTVVDVAAGAETTIVVANLTITARPARV